MTDRTIVTSGSARTGTPAVRRGPVTGSSRWLRAFPADEDPAARLVCFPHAGGTATAFADLAAALPADIALLAVQYPGRQDRRAEDHAADVTEVAEATAAALAPYTGRPLFLLGHSMGALAAFETARLLARQGVVARLFASAARPPADDWQEPDLDTLDDEAVVAGLRRLGGVPDVLLAEPDLRTEVLRLLRADHRLLRGYRCEPDTELSVPITVLLAEDDPKNTAEQVSGWARHTTAAHTLAMHPGGHFGLTERARQSARLLADRIREDLTVRTVDPPADLVREIYLAGPDVRSSRLSTDLTSLQKAAHQVLEPSAYGYVVGDAGTGATGRGNRAAFDRWRVVPRMLRGVTRRDLEVRLFGRELAAPVLLAPVAAQTVVHPRGELASAGGATDTGLPFVLSCFSSHSMEEVAAAAGSQPRWFQLYWPSDPALAESLVRRAEAAGYDALVLTVDNPAFGYRPTDLDNGYLPFLHGAGLANFTSDPVFNAALPPGAGPREAVAHWASVSANPALTWDRLPWLRQLTDLPLLVKGVLHPEDARAALAHGADGVIVSNHGGRQLDATAAALDCLPAVRAAVGDGVPVLMDSGVRTGADVVKALALGADAVLLGRPYLYGMALDGRDGVRHVLRCLLAELDLALTLSGCGSVRDLTPELLAPVGPLAAPRQD
ncbi:FMN-dependent dehydrogenase, includes L-lactate dehydrogenase and type II isopentenyl diphosphate isomerase [Streptomyces sp. Ncost-T6T-1]|uniref:alpha-hydroxy-acid oxidizing protein n=1 Tax=Streptomyces sp. Ncost-T6T-1 TaxID=1100828 RepID=UPI000804D5B9|nr:alpha-hydroxy-acid oxidizing protein [Streptomyces sp. Ncost-T6T-1]SBV04569.1 FMN-dependent dehydrogenase, includes L-lactate dehydrogenase and type II isopentenyl diphosphate isomerase [Streptomyces sp. Ncost-T6T-1]